MGCTAAQNLKRSVRVPTVVFHPNAKVVRYSIQQWRESCWQQDCVPAPQPVDGIGAGPGRMNCLRQDAGRERRGHRTAGRVTAGLRACPSCLEWMYGNYPGQTGQHCTGAAGTKAETACHVQGGAVE